ncbi:uncharacterized protein [Eurosta solidaginis]|uniref:uncharacterized protein n=1 Tax=Eurosta solidaginis TaxID=178769 RepID=UPI0035313AA7
MREKDFLCVANQICAKFPGEKVEVYYNKSSKYPSGKLYHFYKNSVARLRKESLFPAKRTAFQSQFDYLPEDIEEIPSSSATVFEDHKELLRHFCEPWEEVQRRWVETIDYRRISLSYKKSFGKTLIDIDFNKISYGNCYGLHVKWESFIEVFMCKDQSFIKDKHNLELFSILCDITNKIYVMLQYLILCQLYCLRQGLLNRKINNFGSRQSVTLSNNFC